MSEYHFQWVFLQMKCELLSAVVLKEVSSPYHIKEINNQAVPWIFFINIQTYAKPGERCDQ